MALPDFTRVLATYDNVNAPLQRWLPAERVSELGKLLHSRAARVRAQITVTVADEAPKGKRSAP